MRVSPVCQFRFLLSAFSLFLLLLLFLLLVLPLLLLLLLLLVLLFLLLSYSSSSSSSSSFLFSSSSSFSFFFFFFFFVVFFVFFFFVVFFFSFFVFSFSFFFFLFFDSYFFAFIFFDSFFSFSSPSTSSFSSFSSPASFPSSPPSCLLYDAVHFSWVCRNQNEKSLFICGGQRFPWLRVSTFCPLWVLSYLQSLLSLSVKQKVKMVLPILINLARCRGGIAQRKIKSRICCVEARSYLHFRCFLSRSHFSFSVNFHFFFEPII